MRRQFPDVHMPHFRVRHQEGRQRRAVVVWRCMRSGSVLVPRSTSHESNGLRIAPQRSAELQPLDVIVSTAITTPPMLSLWPLGTWSCCG